MGAIIVPKTPHLWTRRPKIIEPRSALIVGLEMAGEFRLRVIRPDGSCRVDTGFFPNLITDTGLNQPGVSTRYDAISVGTGSATPAVTDTTLQTRLATTATVQAENYAQDGTPGDAAWYHSYTRTMRFAQGAAAGNLTEIGMTRDATPWTTFSRALILDGGGSPTTLTILSSEYLDATYRLRWYAGSVLTDVADTIDISGTSYDIVLRRAEVDGGGNMWRANWMWNGGVGMNGNFGSCSATDGTLGTTSTVPSGTYRGTTSVANAAYVADTHYRDWSAFFGLNEGNLTGGIDAFNIQTGTGNVSPGSGGSGAAAYQFSVTPAIPKTSSHLLTMNFRQTWARRTL